MNTKEAIKILRSIENTYIKENVSRPCVDEVMSFRHIINLLQRGEKFEQMWGKMYSRLGSCYLTVFEKSKYYSGKEDRREQIKTFMIEIKQKYFPKGGK